MCDSCNYEENLKLINEMLDDGYEYEFAEDTLSGIREWIEENKHVTEKQEQAILNIYNSKK